MSYGRRNVSFRWRLNETLFQNKNIVDNNKMKLREFFKMNLDKGTNLQTLWDASKAFMRSCFI